ncbi:MAG TPA: hypothetical protein VKK61_05965 [Tepidisphaeraceae bacterium]|nr:hypothetical protein [Tepidisphaeraceae bacterium]
MSRKYQQYKNSETWRVLNRAISALVKNGDLEEKTAREYIVGYLSQKLADQGIQSNGELKKSHKLDHASESNERRIKVAG